MQETLSTPIQVVQKQITGNYWTGVILNGAATLFLDEDQLNLIKVMLVMALPVIAIYTKVKISEMSAFLPVAMKMIATSSQCHQGYCS